MKKKYKVLAINPGSTSTKIAVYEEGKDLFEEVIRHSTEEIAGFTDIYAQYDYRLDMVEKALLKHGFAVSDLNAVVGRGGALKSISGGTYEVNEAMVDDLYHRVQTHHASNLGGLIARGLAKPHSLPAFIVDPVCVDEMEPIARISGWPEMPRRSIFHALNLKATARRAAHDLGKNLEDVTLVMGHLGGGISFAVQQNGRMIDVCNPMDGGAFSPERTGYLPLSPLVELCYSGRYTFQEMMRKMIGLGGLTAHLGTGDAREVEARIEAGDEQAKLVYQAMAYQIAKEIGAMATVVNGSFDAIVLTGGLSYSKCLVEWVRERVQFMGKFMVYPGEDELLALSQGALRVLHGEETAKVYE